jgi:FkbH-like protein
VGLGSDTGIIFQNIQQSILELKKKGILLGICSKNNSTDVEEVFEKHPGMILRSKDIDIKKVNWNDKASNLRAMALELNLGLDSFVFLDDSSYEVDFIKKNIPEVLTLKVPQSLNEYPLIMKQIEYLFWSPRVTDEDKSRSSMMQAEQLRSTEKKKFHSVADYLKDLDLKLKIEINPTQWISRLSQLTMKTNQFNTTTLRMTETELEQIYSRSDCRVYAFDARDKYGDYGITGLSIAELQNNEATLKVFLMSCRTIGRDFERAFFNFITSDLKSLGIKTLHCPYYRTQKNN